MKWMLRPDFLDSVALQVEKKMPTFGKKGPHKEAFYSLLSLWREFEMEDQRIQKGAVPLKAEKEKGVYGLSCRPFRKPAISLISQNGGDKTKSSRPGNLYLPSREKRERHFHESRNQETAAAPQCERPLRHLSSPGKSLPSIL
jgi:hypothetical protein